MLERISFLLPVLQKKAVKVANLACQSLESLLFLLIYLLPTCISQVSRVQILSGEAVIGIAVASAAHPAMWVRLEKREVP